MSYGNSDVIRVRIEGTIGSAQTWSCSFYISLTTVSGSPLDQTHLALAMAQLNTPVGTLNTALAGLLWSADTTINRLSLYYYNANQDKAAHVSHIAAGGVLGSVTTYQPQFVSLVLSVLSDTPGRSGRGRMYLPVTAYALPSDHQFSQATLNSVGAACKALFQSVNALNMVPSGIASQQCVVASSTKSATYPVTELALDSKPDVQHRRSDKQLYSHAYVSGAL